ncbi:MAG: TrmJ/YjtD family RNA methyltransferase [Thermoplasmataceae archaeon]|jgi:tRNA/rRNA methyltransferase
MSEEDIKDRLSSLSKRVSVVLVEPKYPGNIGAVARVMKNTGLNSLYLLGGAEINDEALIRAVHGRDVLESSRRIESMDAIRDFADYIVGTSSVPTLNRKKFVRIPMNPDDLWKRLLPSGKRIAVLLGREDDGLRTRELEICDFFVYIPANPEYPAYNLSHAAAIILYDLFKQVYDSSIAVDPIRGQNLERMMDRIADIVALSGYPGHKSRNLIVMIRRILSRADLSETEFFKMMGILKLVKLKMAQNDEGRDSAK